MKAMEADPARNLFARAACMLAGARGSSTPDVNALLHRLGYADGDSTDHRAALLRAASKLRRVFQLSTPDAPGLVFMGGEADPAAVAGGEGHRVASLAGSGLTLGAAFERCVGEGIEYLSQVGTAHLTMTTAARSQALDPASTAFIKTVAGDTGNLDWIAATRLSDGAPVHLPADLCVRRLASVRDFTPPLKLGTGCAAGPSVAAATLHGLLELLERDAAALWWRGGARGRLLALDSAPSRDGAALLARLRGDAGTRVTWLLDITTDLAVPCIAAVSGRDDGRGFACGFACRPTMAAAATSAIFELCQMELGQILAAAKRHARGDAALNEGDHAHLRRATLIDAATCALLHPMAPARITHEDTDADPASALQRIMRHLADAGIETYAVDLTHPELNIPVVRVLAPGLQLDPCAIVTERLAATIRRTGGGNTHSQGVALL